MWLLGPPPPVCIHTFARAHTHTATQTHPAIHNTTMHAQILHTGTHTNIHVFFFTCLKGKLLLSTEVISICTMHFKRWSKVQNVKYVSKCLCPCKAIKYVQAINQIRSKGEQVQMSQCFVETPVISHFFLTAAAKSNLTASVSTYYSLAMS